MGAKVRVQQAGAGLTCLHQGYVEDGIAWHGMDVESCDVMRCDDAMYDVFQSCDTCCCSCYVLLLLPLCHAMPSHAMCSAQPLPNQRIPLKILQGMRAKNIQRAHRKAERVGSMQHVRMEHVLLGWMRVCSRLCIAAAAAAAARVVVQDRLGGVVTSTQTIRSLVSGGRLKEEERDKGLLLNEGGRKDSKSGKRDSAGKQTRDMPQQAGCARWKHHARLGLMYHMSWMS